MFKVYVIGSLQDIVKYVLNYNHKIRLPYSCTIVPRFTGIIINRIFLYIKKKITAEERGSRQRLESLIFKIADFEIHNTRYSKEC